MPDRITVELVAGGGRPTPAIISAGGENIDEAMSAFDTAVADADENILLRANVVLRATLLLQAGTVVISGAASNGYDEARDVFDAAKVEYMKGGAWGGSG